jgi:hypothetical protein
MISTFMLKLCLGFEEVTKAQLKICQLVISHATITPLLERNAIILSQKPDLAIPISLQPVPCRIM